jgi:hypothetical protein
MSNPTDPFDIHPLRIEANKALLELPERTDEIRVQLKIIDMLEGLNLRIADVGVAGSALAEQAFRQLIADKDFAHATNVMRQILDTIESNFQQILDGAFDPDSTVDLSNLN